MDKKRYLYLNNVKKNTKYENKIILNAKNAKNFLIENFVAIKTFFVNCLNHKMFKK